VGEPYEPDPIASASPDVNPKDPPDPSAKQEINIDDLEDFEQAGLESIRHVASTVQAAALGKEKAHENRSDTSPDPPSLA
jgi:hypothetical protein